MGLLIVTIAFKNAIAAELKCEPGNVIGQKTCHMQQTTTIDSDKDTIASKRDEIVSQLNLSGNKKIFFLPIRVDESFPNLTGYDAHDCSLTSLSLEPFRNLRKLKYLTLNQNQIEYIDTDTFTDLGFLEYLALGNEFMFFPTNSMLRNFYQPGDNQISFLTKGYFQRMRNLTLLNLSKNRIENIANATFDDLTSLKELYLGS